MEWAADADELIECARYDEDEDLELLLTKYAGVDGFVEHRNAFGQSALQNASANGHLRIVKRLLSAGAKPNSANAQGNTPLHWACLMGHVDTVKALIAGGADTNVRNNQGRTPLDEAYTKGHSTVFDYLAELSAQPGKQAMEEAKAENAQPDPEEDGEDDGDGKGSE